ncbi:MAG: DUF4442 domain-containing protein [Bacteroidetes bacterium]|nr:DUF4442 domain-containing protein [Bacteroidota bacterium]
MASQVNSFIQLIRHPVKFRMFLFKKLPSAFFAGVRVKEADENKCVVTVPYKWFSTNPFRSTYFACLAMAAEMSTGVLAMMHVYKRSPKVSMLVIKLEAEYFKKATGVTTFTCNEGQLIFNNIQNAVTTGESQTTRIRSIGVNENGEPVAEFFITWSFKAKKVG